MAETCHAYNAKSGRYESWQPFQMRQSQSVKVCYDLRVQEASSLFLHKNDKIAHKNRKKESFHSFLVQAAKLQLKKEPAGTSCERGGVVGCDWQGACPMQSFPPSDHFFPPSNH
eukprot:1549486-Amphidinium_carterae.1